ncbi:MAG TPA: D-glycero-beta-D-manno-heptose 1-phosphate adenylyltransferase [Pseudonocardia sp.]|jgi:rfaE bifunctional protein nucleotidyltransferase chain/domain/rfaE bifunctional protein kinase chain/domain|uniref:D-glycero-beta-D-manno-heptose 1-phosphate adenylyltransferase n=1 Tax=Pseudonocardia sp. TaxID=60912 RepID=UPI002B4B9106|nr:D-glycero-beta-D-manno-heptose 1-phosphate adenylyltransferase [Pseudonocardia sp.]HLU57414.1 D-glycero-beta-D-manno-heptose 1-phosphate adenylyltransferase [Pseudonocardia sp.]
MRSPRDALTAPAAPAALAGRIADRAPRVVVLGDALLDGWLSGPARRLGRDGPVPVVEVSESRTQPGGAGNTAANLAALGARVDLVAVLGDDPAGVELSALLTAAGVGTAHCVTAPGRATAVKRRITSGGQTLARYDAAPDGAPRPSTTAALVGALEVVLAEPADAVVVADYGLGTGDRRVRAALSRLRARIPLLVVDAHRPGAWAVLRPDLLTPSIDEAAALIAEPEPVGSGRAEWVLARRHALTRAAGGGEVRTEVIVTLDEDGAVRLPADPAEPAQWASARPGPQARACGAGDTFSAAVAAARATGIDPQRALGLAQCAADVVVGEAGTAVCTTGALTARLAERDRGGLVSHRDLLAIVAEHRRRGSRIVFTNGCFDVLHRGHVAYLRQARALGDLLVVALNDDGSVARLKGPERPVNPLEDRAGVVGAIECVDLVTSFAHDTPAELIEAVRPDVYTKGGDYTPQMLPETPIVERLGGEVRVLDYLSDHSTTAIVGRIKAGRP